MRPLTVLLVAPLAYHAAAHGIATAIWVGTKTYQGYNPNFQYMPTPPPKVVGWASPATQDMGPVDATKYQDPDIICQRNATPATSSVEVTAGDNVAVQWTRWPESHHGPMIDYLADCGADCSTVDKAQLKWFKIDGVGLTGVDKENGNWGDDDMIAANNTWTVQIPASIKAGNYVLRHETIALHQAQGKGGAQNYPQCINLQVTGDGTDTPAGVVGTALYKDTDPGIMFNIYQQFTSTEQYTVPGPPLYSGASNAAAPAPAGNSSTNATNVNVAAQGPALKSTSGSMISNKDNNVGLIATPEEAYQNARKQKRGFIQRK